MQDRPRLPSLLLLCLSVHEALCSSTECCNSLQLSLTNVPSSNELNVLLNKQIKLNFETEGIMCNNTVDGFVEHELMLIRHDGETEIFSLMNVKLHHPSSTEYYDVFNSNGFSYHGVCFFNNEFSCLMIITFNPENNRYNGAEIIPLAHFPNCSKTLRPLRTPVLNIQGLLEAPSDVMLDIISRDRVIVSWSPPYTLDGIPILYYTVNVISQGIIIKQVDTTETNITLERPCVSTTYQISAWNDVGEGNATISDLLMYEASVMVVSSSICLSCTFLPGSCVEGCAVKLENNEHTFYFNTSRLNDEEVTVLECFSVQEEGVFNVYVYEIQYGQLQENTSRQLENVTILFQETKQNQDYDHAVAIGCGVVVGVSGVIVICIIVTFMILRRIKKMSFQTVRSATNPSDEHVYDVIGHKTTIKTMTTSEEIELKSNAAYAIIHPL